MTISTLIRLYAIITDAVYDLQHTIADRKELYRVGTILTSDLDGYDSLWFGTRNPKIQYNGERFSQKYAE